MTAVSARPDEPEPRSARRAARGDVGPAGPAGRRPPTRPARRTATTHAEVDELARAVALLWLEVESGRRRPASVARLLDHALWHRLRTSWVRGGPPGRLVRVVVEHHSPTLCDAVAVVRRGTRTGALSIRLRRRPDGWCVVEGGLPEVDGAA